MQRRSFVKKSGLVSLGFLGLRSYANIYDEDDLVDDYIACGYGKLKKDPEGILKLPEGFSYKIISQRGNTMSDGLLVPGLADGMGTFPGPNPNQTIIIRNHEVSPLDSKNGAFGEKLERLNNISKDKFYDYGSGSNPCQGGTTTMIYNHDTQVIEKQWLSLAGTDRNCAGGVTPWGSWISCEESVLMSSKILEKDHGYPFEVPVTTDIKLHDPIPIKAMGRFNHEAVCVDPRTSIVYQTEDRSDGLIYRYIPDNPKDLHQGGKLQLLAIRERKTFDTRNWTSTGAKRMKVNKLYEVDWLDIDNVESPNDDLRYRGAQAGAAIFARGEGIWFGNNEFYFACTNGGRKEVGQIFRYTPSPYEGQEEEKNQPARLELFLEPNKTHLVENCDNLTIAANGDLVICEDNYSPRIVGVTPEGKIYKIAKNVGFKSEFAGATFSPDGSTLFVNIQVPGLTLAITGPWTERVS